jgi:hypothetical protein
MWSDEVDEILDGDLVAGLAYLTPARGVVISPIAPLGLRDRERATVTVTTSLALWRKLDRIRRRPGVAMAYHTRRLGQTSRPGFVLVQGKASFSTAPDRQWLESITPQVERDLGPRKTGLTGRLLHTYYWERVGIEIAVERVIAWAQTDASGEPEVFGSPRPGPAPPQKPPGGGTGARVKVERVARAVERHPDTLLGWCGADELPEVVPVLSAETADSEIRLQVPAGSVPPGGRRAGLTSHAFNERMLGQDQRIHTGWLEGGDGAVRYAPHTRSGYRLPNSELAYTLACATLPVRMRTARKKGLAPAR